MAYLSLPKLHAAIDAANGTKRTSQIRAASGPVTTASPADRAKLAARNEWASMNSADRLKWADEKTFASARSNELMKRFSRSQ